MRFRVRFITILPLDLRKLQQCLRVLAESTMLPGDVTASLRKVICLIQIILTKCQNGQAGKRTLLAKKLTGLLTQVKLLIQ